MKTLITILLLTGLIRLAFSQEFLMPMVELRDLDGKLISSTSLLQQGYPTLLVFWNPDCPEHNRSLDAINQAWSSALRPTGIRMVLVATGYSGGPYTRIRSLLNDYEFDRCIIDINESLRRSLALGTGACILVYDAEKSLGKLDGGVLWIPALIAECVLNMLGYPIQEKPGTKKIGAGILPRIRDMPIQGIKHMRIQN